MKKITGLLLFLAAACLAPAQFVFSVTATANATGSGYTAGQTAVFVFNVTGADVSANVGNRFFSYTNQWWDDVTADVPLFTAIGGTGLSGTFIRPSVTTNDPFSYIQALPATSNQLTFTAGAESSGLATIGLVAGGTPVNYILAGNLEWGNTFAAPGSYTAPTAYFTPFLGTHALNSGGYVEISLAGGPLVSFTATSLTISAVPEPSTYALLLTGGGLLAAGHFRRRKAA